MHNTERGPASLPEVLSKAAWHDLLDSKIAEARQNDTPLFLAFIDLNRFKDVNDTLGHSVGDDVLYDIQDLISVVSKTLRTNPRPDGSADTIGFGHTEAANNHGAVAGRVGGDEFAIAGIADAEGVEIFTKRVRSVFEKYINLPENAHLKDLGLGMAIGTVILQPGMNGKELLEAADKAMYKDKAAQLPKYSEKQDETIETIRELLRINGLRLRDVVSYERTLDSLKSRGIDPEDD